MVAHRCAHQRRTQTTANLFHVGQLFTSLFTSLRIALAEQRLNHLLEETGLTTAYYLPKSALVADAQPIELSTHCPFKGDASYWTIAAGGRTHDAIAWSYEQPKAGAEEIEGHVAFFSNRAQITVDGTPV